MIAMLTVDVTSAFGLRRVDQERVDLVRTAEGNGDLRGQLQGCLP